MGEAYLRSWGRPLALHSIPIMAQLIPKSAGPEDHWTLLSCLHHKSEHCHEYPKFLRITRNGPYKNFIQKISRSLEISSTLFTRNFGKSLGSTWLICTEIAAIFQLLLTKNCIRFQKELKAARRYFMFTLHMKKLISIYSIWLISQLK